MALGCPKNVVDSEKMLAQMGGEGFLIGADADGADVVVINTCGFIEPAREEAFEAIENAVKSKRNGNIGKIVVTGCLAQKMGAELTEKYADVDAVVGLGDRDKIADVISGLFKTEERSIYIGGDEKIVHDDSGRLLITAGHWAYLRISEGCSRKCSFCTIPEIRGPFHSKPMEMIVAEAKELAAAGVRELIIIAQDSSNYGKDLGMKDGLVGLLDELEKIEGVEWIRVMYMYPASVTDAIIEKIAGSEKIVNYIDMPVQHINDDVLKAMYRSDTKAKTMMLIEKLRSKMEDVVLRTSVIVGFPGETDEQFDELLEFIKWARFDMLGAFAYSKEDGTGAAGMDGQVYQSVKQGRLDEVMRTQQEIAFEKNKSMVGKVVKVLVDEVEDNGDRIGRCYGQAPEIDSLCLVSKCKARVGEFVNVRVIDAVDYDLVAEEV